jgi:putative phosphoesterase
MIVGIISDSHDNLPLIDKAIKMLNDKKVELVLHAGDYVAPFVVAHFKPLKAPLIGVFGADLRGRFAFVLIDGLRVALLHGDEKELMKSLLELESHDVIVYGHTHLEKIYRKGRTLVINPGSVGGYLTEKPTIAILDTKTLDTKILELDN